MWIKQAKLSNTRSFHLSDPEVPIEQEQRMSGTFSCQLLYRHPLLLYLWTQFVPLSSSVFSAKGIIMQLDDGATLTPTFLQRNGFNVPILILEKAKLGLRVPPHNFTIYDVEMKVGRFYVLLA